jgi:carbon starvation protein
VIALIVVLTIVVLAAGYWTYGKYLARHLDICDDNPTPACVVNDGVDYVPAPAFLLLGQHFSAIAAAGPIVGPILAGIWFGWVPALIWILVGSIFIGGMHDFASLIASVRSRAVSIGTVVRENMSRTSYMLFLIFVWLCLEYVIIAFTDITAQTFKTIQANEAYGPAVAASSILYILAAMLMGVLWYKAHWSLGVLTAIFLPLVLLIVWVGPLLPPSLLAILAGIPTKGWDAILLLYCLVASIIPVWLLLQPRGYLGGWLLYLVIAIGLVGAIFGGFTIEYPAFNLTSDFRSLANARLLFPMLFITVACGACSGFHGIVSSGTTSKQLARESDARPVGYGAMLLEGLVAVLALATVMMLPKGDAMLKADPNLIYANGIASYLGLIGVGFTVAFPFALLAFSTFVYDTLDVSTRLSRYILQELLGIHSRTGAILATAASLVLPFIFLMLTREKGYLVAWPIFGTSNQLLASLTLLTLAVWLHRTGRNAWIALLPMAFMMIMTFWSLWLQISAFARALHALSQGGTLTPDNLISGLVGVLLLVLSLWLLVEAVRTLVSNRSGQPGGRKPDGRH